MRLPTFFKPEPQQFGAGARIFETGDKGETMYLVQEGQVDLLVRDQVVETVGPEGFFGEMALIDKGTRSAAAVARTDCVLIPVNQRQFTFLIQETPFFALEVMKVMSARLRRGNARDCGTVVEPGGSVRDLSTALTKSQSSLNVVALQW